MELRQDSFIQYSHQSMGFLDEKLEELSVTHRSVITIKGRRDDLAQLSARLFDKDAPPTYIEAVGNLPIISSSATTAWKSHLSKLDLKEKQLFEFHSQDNLISYVNEIEMICQNSGDANKARNITQLFRPWFPPKNQSTSIANTMIQADCTSSAVVPGGIICIMSISTRYIGISEHVIELFANMGQKLDLLMEYESSTYQNNDSVQNLVVEIFSDILDICRLALRLFRTLEGKGKGRLSNAFQADTTSFQEYFGDLFEKYDKDLKIFVETVKLVDRGEKQDQHSIKTDVASNRLAQPRQIHADLLSDDHHQITAVNSVYQMMVSFDNHLKMTETIHHSYEEIKAKDLLREKLLTWLRQSSVEFNTDQNEKAMKRLAETGVWIIENQMYLKWRGNPESQLLWINGKRGCGKSFLASAVVQDLKGICEGVENLKKQFRDRSAFAFFYCTSLEKHKHDVSKLLCSLVEQLSHQLPRPNVDPVLDGIYSRHGGSRPPDLNETKKALESLLGSFKTTFLVMDGLDELRILEDEHFEAQCHYLRSLVKPRTDGCTVKIVAFSRPDHRAIIRAFTNCPELRVDTGANDDDILKYTSTKLTRIETRFSHNKNLLEEIRQELLKRAEGMFLWVRLVINSLEDERTPVGLREKVKSLPVGLDLQYTTSLQKIAGRTGARESTFMILLWINNAKRPLKRAELLEALSVRAKMLDFNKDYMISDDSDICSDCENLVFFDQKQEIYQLIHSSVKDFLTECPSSSIGVPERYRFLQKKAHYFLGEICLTYLNFERFSRVEVFVIDDLTKILVANPFLAYASTYWGKHVAAAEDGHLHDLTMKLITSPERRKLLMQLLVFTHTEKSTLFCGKSTPLHVLAIFNLVEVAKTMTDINAYLTQQDGLSATPFDYALVYESREMCNYLLEIFKDLEIPESDMTCRYLPIHLAASHGWPEVVKSLIALECDPRIKTYESKTTALHVAAIQGSTDVLDILLETTIDKDAQDLDGSTPLLLACEENNSSCAKKLINAGARVNLSGWNGTTPLHHAAKNGDLELVTLLLREGTDINARCDKNWGFRTALHLAAEEGFVEVLQHLIHEHADIDAVGASGFTALHFSIIGNDLKCLDAILKQSVRIDLTTDNRQSPIHLAVDCENLDILMLLYRSRKQEFTNIIDGLDIDNDTPLDYAARKGNLEIAKFLVECGAVISGHPKSRQAPVHTAISLGHTKVAEWLLRRDLRCAALKGVLGSPTLHYVAHYGAKYPSLNELIILLLEADTNLEAKNDDGHRAIHFAMKAGNLWFANALLDHNRYVDLEPLSTNLETPMYLAAAGGMNNSVQWLLDHSVALEQPKTIDNNFPMQISAWNQHLNVLQNLLTPQNINEKGPDKRTALFGAAIRGHLDIVQFLLGKGADPNIPDEFHQTPLSVCIMLKHTKIAHLLLDADADPNTPAAEGQIALHDACVAGDETLVQRLIEANCDPLHRNNLGSTPFMSALTSSNPQILEILLQSNCNPWRDSDYQGTNCLHHLAAFGSIRRLKHYKGMINSDDFKAVDEIGRNALYYASENGHAQIFGELLSLGVPLQGANDSPRGPLHEAASLGFVSAVQELINLRQNTISIDEHRELFAGTALHQAALSRHPITVGLLLQAGANPHLRSCLGLTALDYVIRHPHAWENTGLTEMGVSHTNLGHRMVRLKATAYQALQNVLRTPENLTSRDEYYRTQSLILLATALLEMRTSESLGKALVCCLELMTPIKGQTYSLTWICEICGKRKFGGSKFVCRAAEFSSFLCHLCHSDYQKGDGTPNTAPRSLRILEGLEQELKPIRLALMPFVQFGSRFVIFACNLLKLSRVFLAEKRKEYKEWVENYNLDGRYHDQNLNGLKFINWLEKAHASLREINKHESQQENDEIETEMWTDKARNESKSIQPYARSDEVKSTNDEDEPNAEKTLDQELFDLFRNGRPDKEIHVFACDGHEFLELSTTNTASQEQKSCVGEDGRITKVWLQKLGEWIEKLSCEGEIKPQMDSNQVGSEVVRADRDAGIELKDLELQSADGLMVKDDDEHFIGCNEQLEKEQSNHSERVEKLNLLERIRKNLAENLNQYFNEKRTSNSPSWAANKSLADSSRLELLKDDHEVESEGLKKPTLITESRIVTKSDGSSASNLPLTSEQNVLKDKDEAKGDNSLEKITVVEYAVLAHEASWRLAQGILSGEIDQTLLREKVTTTSINENEEVGITEQNTEEQVSPGKGRLDSATMSSQTSSSTPDEGTIERHKLDPTENMTSVETNSLSVGKKRDSIEPPPQTALNSSVFTSRAEREIIDKWGLNLTYIPTRPISISLNVPKESNGAMSRWLMPEETVRHLRSEYEGVQDLTYIMIIAGGEQDARCVTCSSYLAQFEQMQLIGPVLDVLNQSLFSATEGKEFHELYLHQADLISFGARRTGYRLEFFVNASPSALTDSIGNILRMISAALRPASPESLYMSEVTLVNIDNLVRVELMPLRPVKQKSCWHAIFPSTSIAATEIQHPANMNGLEIPFDLMIDLCGSDIPLQIDGGICISGIYTLLVPLRTAIDEDGNTCLQWHLFCVQPDSGTIKEARAALWSEWERRPQEYQEWLKIKKLEGLTNHRRHFLGWCRYSKLTLGTRDQSYEITYSDANYKEREISETSTTVNATLVNHGAGFGVSRMYKRSRTAKSPFENKDRPSLSWLAESMKDQVILYCPSRKQAWLVPKISTLLHLILAYMHRLARLHPHKLPLIYPYCQDNSTTAQDAYNVLFEHADDYLPELGKSDVFKMKDLILKFLYLFDQLSRITRSTSINRTFYGFEALDLVRHPKNYRLAEANTGDDLRSFTDHGGWIKLLEKVEVVLFFEGIKDLIVPTTGGRCENEDYPCRHWTSMPPHRYLLASTVYSLQCLVEDSTIRDCSRLTRTTFWLSRHSPFEECESENGGCCQRLQAIGRRRTANGPDKHEIQKYSQGAVIFASGISWTGKLRGSSSRESGQST